MSVKAKVKLINKTTTEYCNADGTVQLTFQAVHGSENEEWSKFTPALNLSMTVKSEVGEKFSFGEYYLTFEEA